MQGLTLSHPSLFRATSGAVAVDEEDGTPFYYRVMRKGKTFTLPAGKWNVQGASFVRPMRTRNRGKGTEGAPPRFVIEYGFNPNLASVWPKSGRILLDTSIMDMPRSTRSFIILHELGHCFYESEEACDKFAAIAMRDLGFNPSQIAAATRDALSVHAKDRHKSNLHRAKRMDRRISSRA